MHFDNTTAPHGTLYIPIASPPTPAPSPGPELSTGSSHYANAIPPLLALPHTTDPGLRKQLLTNLLNACTPSELLFISQTIAPLLKRDFLASLPAELALHVLSFVDEPKTLGRAMRVSRAWYGIVRDESVWRRMCTVQGFVGGEDIGAPRSKSKNKRRKHTLEEEEDDYGAASQTYPTDSSSSSPYRRRPPDTFSYRRHFKTSYIVLTNWRHGGTLLQTHRLPILAPAHPTGHAVAAAPSDTSGTVTSLALDADWVVVGLANSNIKVYSARTGVLARTLVGHESGVWGVCLASRGGWMEGPRAGGVARRRKFDNEKERKLWKQRDHESSAVDDVEEPFASQHQDIQRKRNRLLRRIYNADGDTTTTTSTNVGTSSALNDLSGLSLQADGEGGRVDPSGGLSHSIPMKMKIALGIEVDQDSGDSEQDASADVTVEEDEENVFDEDAYDQRREWSEKKLKSKLDPPRWPFEETADDGDEDGNRTTESAHQGTPGKQSNMSFSSTGWGQPNSIVVSGGCDKVLRVWDAKSGQCIYALHGHTATIRSLRVLHNRPIAVTGSRDATLRVWDVQQGRCLRVLEGHEQSVRCLDVCGNKVVSGSYDTTCRIWNIDTGECLHILTGHFHQIYSVAFDGVRIASGGLDTTVRVWDAETGQCIALLQGHTALVCQLQLSPTLLATGGSDGRVITFSLATYTPLHRIAAHDSSVASLQFDNEFLVTGGNDGRVRLWEVESGSYVRELSEPSEHVWKVAFGGGGLNKKADIGGAGRDVLAIMCKRNRKTAVEIWSLRPKKRDALVGNVKTIKRVEDTQEK